MANYNGMEYLADAIDSVVKQEFTDFEFVIVDDGSTDGSRQIIAEYQQHHPDLVLPIYQPENRGQGAAFNAGIAASRGEVICFLDSDDLWFPEKLGQVHAFFASHSVSIWDFAALLSSSLNPVSGTFNANSDVHALNSQLGIVFHTWNVDVFFYTKGKIAIIIPVLN